MSTEFELLVHPYCGKCDDFFVITDERQLIYDGYMETKRYITCKNYNRCSVIERHLRKEIENENNTGKLRDTN